MEPTGSPAFDSFASEFVRAYWQTVKSGAFPMPPNEPVEETIEELLAAVSHEVEVRESSNEPRGEYQLRMLGAYGSWWLFSFVRAARGWKLVGAKAPSLDPARPRDLLGAVYEPHFGPFLRHVTEVANERLRR